jgi:hypothetical protein
MSTRERAFERLVAINPLTEVEEFAPSIADAEAFLRSIEEGPMDTKTRKLLEPLEPRPSRRPWMVAAAAFAVVILVIGGVALWPAGSTDTPPATPLAPIPTTTPPPTTVSPTTAAPDPTPPSPAQAVVIGELVAAYNTGDIDRYMALFANQVTFFFPDNGGPDAPQGFNSGTEWSSTPALWRSQKAWEMAIGGSIELFECAERSGAAECSIRYSDAFVSDVMGTVLEGTASFVLDGAGRIVDYRQDWGTDGRDHDLWTTSFDTWLEDTHPDERARMGLNMSLDPIHSDESAQLWLAMIAEYVASFGG